MDDITFHTSKELAQEKKLTSYMDKYGLIGNSWNGIFDGGDSLQRTGFLALADLWSGRDVDQVRGEFKARLKAHRVGWGLYVRHPDGGEPWMADLRTTSGDQLRPVIVAMGALGLRSDLRQIAIRLLLRGGFYWNVNDTGLTNVGKWKMPDWSGPEHWAAIIRGLSLPEKILLFPLLLIGDLVGLFATLHATFVYPYQRIKNCDQLNRIALLTQGLLYTPTPLSRLSHKIFKTYRPTYLLTIVKKSGIILDRFFKDLRPEQRPDPSTYIVDAYFWSPQDPPLNIRWYNVARKYWRP